MFVLLLAFGWERLAEMAVDAVWYRSNKGRMFEPAMLDLFPPETDEEEDDEDEDW